MPNRIEPDDLRSWRDLEDKVAAILTDCGLEDVGKRTIELVRGSVEIDVFAQDMSSNPPTIMLVECKNWQTAISKSTVHAFHSVMTDSGANVGFLISTAGFQAGAREAARYTNIHLVSWSNFQGHFVQRWYESHFVRCVHEAAEPLVEYTEPMNSRILRKADQLSEASRERIASLRATYEPFVFALMPLWHSVGTAKPPVPELPLRLSFAPDTAAAELPDDVLDASTLRELLKVIINRFEIATAEFDAVFGGRA